MAMKLEQFNLEGYELVPPVRQRLPVQGLHSAMCARGLKEPPEYRLYRHVFRMAPKAKIKIVGGG